MNGKYNFGKVVTIALIVAMVVLASTFALSYSFMNSKINAENQKISELDGKISSQNSTISKQKSTISSLKTNETNMSLTISALEQVTASANRNSTEERLLVNQISQVYGIQSRVIAYNTTVNISADQIIDFFENMNPSNNTTIAVLTSFQNLSFGQGSKSNSTFYNLTLYVDEPGEWGFNWATVHFSQQYFEIYFDNVGNLSETFSVTILEIWRS